MLFTVHLFAFLKIEPSSFKDDRRICKRTGCLIQCYWLAANNLFYGKMSNDHGARAQILEGMVVIIMNIQI